MAVPQGQKARMEEELGRVQELVKELKGSLTESRDNNAELTRQCKRLTEALEAAEVAATTARREKEVRRERGRGLRSRRGSTLCMRP